MRLLILVGLAALALGYWLNLPPAEASYDLADVEAMNELTVMAVSESEDWLTRYVAATKGGSHAK